MCICLSISADPTEIDISYDSAFDIMPENKKVGEIFLSDEEDSVHIEWVELIPQMRGKGFLKDIIDGIKEMYPEKKAITAESSEKHIEKYRHLGFLDRDYDDFREMYFLEKPVQESMSLSQFERRLGDLDTEYREALARYVMEMGWVDNTPLYISFRGSPEQKKMLKEAYEKPLTQKCIKYIKQMMDGDFQIHDFLRITRSCKTA